MVLGAGVGIAPIQLVLYASAACTRQQCATHLLVIEHKVLLNDDYLRIKCGKKWVGEQVW